MTGVSRSEQRLKEKAILNSSKKKKKKTEREMERLPLQTGEDQAAKNKQRE